MKHKWHNEIKAWADGAKIEWRVVKYLNSLNGWNIENSIRYTCPWNTYFDDGLSPDWHDPNLEFRIFREWYDNIPKQGRLCWVWDYSENELLRNQAITVINRYSIEEKLFINNRNVPWRYAAPLTNDEIKQFLTQE
jgi:hypothetical protein